MGAFFLRDAQRVTKLAEQRHSEPGEHFICSCQQPARLQHDRVRSSLISAILARPSKAERMLSSNVSAEHSSEVIPANILNGARAKRERASHPGARLSIGTIFRFQSWIPDVGLRRFFRLATTGPDTLGCEKRER
jgi:hypothetical protein